MFSALRRSSFWVSFLFACLLAPLACSRRPPPDPCAAEIRAKVAGFLAEGRLDRTLRLIRKANRSCPGSASETWAAEVSTLAELGLYSEARGLAAKIEVDGSADAEAKRAAGEARARCDRLDKTFPDTDDARAEMLRRMDEAAKLAGEGQLRAAKEKYLAAWEAWRPNGRALMWAGVASKRLGENAEAQRLFDRAIVELSRETGSEVALDFPEAIPPGFVPAWSPDGRRIAVAHADGISVVDLTLGATHSFRTPESGRVVFAPDGKTLASRGGLWDVATGKRIRKLVGYEGSPLTLSPDGKTMVSWAAPSAPLDATMRLWDVATGQQLKTFEGTGGQVTVVAYSPDGKTLASGSRDMKVHLWDVATGKELRTLAGHGGSITSVTFSPDGKTLASAGADVRLWDAVTGKELRTLPYHDGGDWSVAYSPDGKMLASGGWDNMVRLWDLATGEELRTLAGHKGYYGVGGTWVAYSPDGKMLASTSGIDKTVRLWDLATGKETRTFGIGQPAWVKYSPDGKTLASGGADKTVRLWDLAAGKELRTLAGHEGEVVSVAYSPDGKTLASAGFDKMVRLWDVATGKELRSFAGHTGWASNVTYSPDGKTLASWGADKTVRLWDVATGKELRTLGDSGYALTYSPDGKMLVSAVWADVHLWDVAAGKELRTFAPAGHGNAVKSLACSPDGKTLASATDDGRVHLWDPATGTEIRTLATGHAGFVTYSPDGATLALGMADAVRLWDVAIGKEVRSLQAPWKAERRANVSYSPDGRTLATIWNDGSIRLFGTESGALLATLRFSHGEASGYVFTPSGHFDLLGPDAHAANILYPGCRFGALTFPLDLCEERFLVPGLLSTIQAGDACFAEPDSVTSCASASKLPSAAPSQPPSAAPSQPPSAAPSQPPSAAPSQPVAETPPAPPAPVASTPLPASLAAEQGGCGAGNLRACVTLGEALYNGRGVDKDGVRAVPFFRKACDGGEPTGCVDMGWAYHSGTGVTKDGATAAVEFGKACTASTAIGCFGLGVLHRDGTGVPKDPARAAALFKQACDGGVPAACKILGGAP